MSGANGAAVPDITLDELERLIRLLGMLGSAHDGEVIAAARFAQKWVAEHDTDWRTLLTPEPEQGVTGVTMAGLDPGLLDALEAAHAADRDRVYKNGYQAGLRDMAAQVKAQAHMAATGKPPGSAWTASGSFSVNQQGLAAQGPHRPPGASGGGNWATGTWQSVAQALLERDAQGIPGVFRGGREAQFVADVLSRGFPTLTQAQEDWLRSIASRNGMAW